MRADDPELEAARLTALQRLRYLVPQDQPRLEGLCRVACHVTRSDAAGLAFVSDRFLYFLARFGHLPDRDMRGFALAEVHNKALFLPDAAAVPKPLAGLTRMNCLNGKFADYKSVLAVAVRFEGHLVAVLACYALSPREAHPSEAKSCLHELAALAEAHLAQQAALADLSQRATRAIDRAAGVDT